MKKLLTLLEHHFDIDSSLIKHVSTALTKITYPKGRILLQPGDISDKIYFVEKGMLREYFMDSDSGELDIPVQSGPPIPG
jgi:CRP-like cAMP-binding protein